MRQCRSTTLIAGLLILGGCNSGGGPVANNVVSATIGPAGGTLIWNVRVIPGLDGTRITIPPGALSQPVLISMGLSTEPVAQAGDEGAGPVVDFEPTGTTFAIAAQVTIPVTIADGTGTDDLVIQAVEPDGTSRQIPIGSMSVGLASFQTTGFTRFGAVHHRRHDGGDAPDSGVVCSCPEIPGDACTVAGPPPCECPMQVPCDGGPAPQCLTDSDCGVCQACVNGQCVSNGADCAADGGPVICDCAAYPDNACTVTGPPPCYCPEEVPCDGGTPACLADSDCGPCQICVNGQCGDGPGAVCTVDAGPGSCTSDLACGPCQVCVNNQCLDTPCLPDAGVPTCTQNSDCGPCQICVNSQCGDGPGAVCSTDGGTGIGCECVYVPDGACTQPGPPPCLCPVVVPCDGGSPGTGPCPATEPAAGSTCTPNGQYVLACEYGGDQYGDCTTELECASQDSSGSFTWTSSGPEAICGPQPAACPDTLADVPQGGACDDTSIVCGYPEGRCGCLPCGTITAGPEATGYWNCREWSSVGDACPTPRPKLGDACSTEGARCDYDACCTGPSLGPSMQCENGYWVPWFDGACSCAFPFCPGTDAGPAQCTTDADCGGCPARCVNGQCVETEEPCPLDGGVVVCDCPAEPTDGCYETGPGPCYCPELVPCDGGGPDADAGTGNLQWYWSCGDPVCQAPGPDAGPPPPDNCPAVGSACSSLGQTCGTPSSANCGAVEVCDDHDPQSGGCPL
jgi:hypothetical protein